MTDIELRQEVDRRYLNLRSKYRFDKKIILNDEKYVSVKAENYGFSDLYLSQVMLNKKYGTFMVGFGVVLRIELIEKHFLPYLEDIDCTLPKYNFAATLNISSEVAFPDIILENYFSNHFIRFEASSKGLGLFEQIIDMLYSKKLMPHSESILDMSKLDAMINKEFIFTPEVNKIFVKTNIPIFFKRLVIAKYANNPRYEEYCERTADVLAKYPEKARKENKPCFLNFPDVLRNLRIDLSKIESLKDTNLK